MSADRCVWVVRQNSDLTEGRGPMKDVGIYDSEDEAFEANRSVTGVMGVPSHFGGEIWRVSLGTYPVQQVLVFGHRKDWNDKWGYGWTDLRDRPDPADPEWHEFVRLRKKFDPTFAEDCGAEREGAPK